LGATALAAGFFSAVFGAIVFPAAERMGEDIST